MSTPTLTMFTADEQRAISHILTLSTSLHSTCHISTGYDPASSAHHPFSVIILQKFNGAYTALYGLCTGSTRLNALLRLLREVEINMRLVATKATEERGERNRGRRDGSGRERLREKMTRVKRDGREEEGGEAEGAKEGGRVAKRAIKIEEGTEDEVERRGEVSPSKKKKPKIEGAIVLSGDPEADSAAQKSSIDNPIEISDGEPESESEGEGDDAKVHKVAPSKIKPTRTQNSRVKTLVSDKDTEGRDETAGSVVPGPKKQAKKTSPKTKKATKAAKVKA